jgi:hypothetical protein
VRLLITTFALHVPVGQPMQLFINQRGQPVERGLTPIAPIQKQVGNFFGGRNHDDQIVCRGIGVGQL